MHRYIHIYRLHIITSVTLEYEHFRYVRVIFDDMGNKMIIVNKNCNNGHDNINDNINNKNNNNDDDDNKF